MKTPICDFATEYAASNAVRAHMPGHKGKGGTIDALDLTEISGADSLYEACGIIRESEKNASALFGAHTFYSAEGSSLSIRATVFMLSLYARAKGRRPLIAAVRNVHRSFLTALALTDTDVDWLCSNESQTYISCPVSAKYISEYLESAKELPCALYLTSPDYLGSVADIEGIASACHAHGVLLCVDNAHGAYLKFLTPSLHPIDLGADICCDSAHKTLPVLTGGAYLHISQSAPDFFVNEAKNALALFGSTSPSYLIMQSLDKANAYLSEHKERLAAFIPMLEDLKNALSAHGYTLVGNEPLKITVSAKKFGYTGVELSDILSKSDIVCEFCDADFLVLMLTPENGEDDLKRIKSALLAIQSKPPIQQTQPKFSLPKRAMSVRDAMFSPRETLPLEKSIGHILAAPTISCPPAVPIIVSGERIDEDTARVMQYYGFTECVTVKE